MVESVLNGIKFRRDPLSILNKVSKNKATYQFQAGWTQFTVVNNPYHINRILNVESHKYGEGKWTQRGKYIMGECLITKEGKTHGNRRKLLQPAFSLNELYKREAEIENLVEVHIKSWKEGKILDCKKNLSSLSFNISSLILFGKNFDTKADKMVDALNVLVSAIPNLPIPWPKVIKAKKLIREEAKLIQHGNLYDKMATGNLTFENKVDEILSLMIASIDTSSRIMPWIIYRLFDKKKPFLEKCREELNKVGINGLKGQNKLTYFNKFFYEVLRLYPPVHFIDRRALSSHEIDGVVVKKNGYILLSPLLTQRDPRYFDNPDIFNPNRWENFRNKQGAGLTYFPFGSGSHSCIGSIIAKVSIRLIVSKILQNWNLEPTLKLEDNNSINAKIPYFKVSKYSKYQCL